MDKLIRKGDDLMDDEKEGVSLVPDPESVTPSVLPTVPAPVPILMPDPEEAPAGTVGSPVLKPKEIPE